MNRSDSATMASHVALMKAWKRACVVFSLVLVMIQVTLIPQVTAAPLSLGKSEFLPVDQAFVLTGDLQDNTILLRWTIADGYYLYRHKLDFRPSVPLSGEPGIEDGQEREDEFFGKVQVYHHYLEVSLPIESDRDEMTVEVEYQGCAESGLCYLPQKRTLKLTRLDQLKSSVVAREPLASLR
ncbi:MAG: protein-disulfide reductase DsbD domain-containing protein [Pseudomonadota bacterium]